MSPYLLSFLIGVVAGLRSMTAPAVVSWAVYLRWLYPGGSWVAAFATPLARYILTALALGELVADKLPKTPSRKEFIGFSARILTGAVSGAALINGAPNLSPEWPTGLVLGLAGAITGTLAGYEFRRRLARDIGGYDLPIALLEDTIAIGGGFWIARQVMMP